MNNKLSFICIDKRQRDNSNGQMFITLENGTKVVMPPNIQSVPTLLCVKQKYKLIIGDDILKYFHPELKKANNEATNFQGEPNAFNFLPSSGGTNVYSEKFTSYDLTADELSTKGKSNNRPLHNYVSYSDNLQLIDTPEDTYKPDKVSSDLTIDQLQQQRMNEIPK